MSTPVSSSASYCTTSQFLGWYDIRTVAEALSDTGTPIGATSLGPDGNWIINPTIVEANPTFVQLLQGAAGKIEAVCLMGGKYSLTDLQTLANQSPPSNQTIWLAQINADIAAPEILGRRFMEFPDFVKRAAEADGVLKALRDGEMIFGLLGQIDAGFLDPQHETPCTVDKRALATYTARRLFGRRNNRISQWPYGYGGGCG
jgi:hypothetical protein